MVWLSEVWVQSCADEALFMWNKFSQGQRCEIWGSTGVPLRRLRVTAERHD